MISRNTSTAATASTAAPSRRSTLPQAVMTRPKSTLKGSPANWSATLMPRSGQLADGVFEQAPGLVAELGLPLAVEASVAQLGAEAVRCRLAEAQSLGFQVGLDGFVEGLDVIALLHAGVVDGVGDDGLDVAGQRFPGPAVGDEPETVPDVIADGAVFLHLVEFCDLNDRQRVFLRIDDAGLQRRIDLAELQAGRRRPQRLEHRNAERRDRDADFQSFHVLGAFDRLVAAGDLAEAVVPDLLE